jgi:cell division septation protein DedD
MNELTQHIENLLLENDFVIIPDFGGFVAHYNQAQNVDAENTFCPPTRTIGFNPNLTLNDGLLVQSYMSVHDTDFSGATKMVNEAVKQLITTLHEDGKVELPSIGELHYTMRHTYDFVPYNEKVVTPSLYGLQAFVMMPLSELRKAKKETAKHPVAPVSNRSYNIRLNRTLLRNAVAVAVAVFTFFALSIPVENTYMAKGSYAQLLPMDVFETIEGQSVLTTPVKKDSEQSQKSSKKAAKKAAKEAKKEAKKSSSNNSSQPVNNNNNSKPVENNSQPVNNNSKPVENNSKPVENNSQPVNNNSKPVENNSKPVQNNTQQTKPAANANNNSVSNKPATNVQTEKDGKYHVIVASSITRTKAEELVAKLKKLGYTLATILDNGSTLRVSLTSSTDRDAANKAMNQARNKDGFSDAWVMSY